MGLGIRPLPWRDKFSKSCSVVVEFGTNNNKNIRDLTENHVSVNVITAWGLGIAIVNSCRSCENCKQDVEFLPAYGSVVIFTCFMEAIQAVSALPSCMEIVLSLLVYLIGLKKLMQLHICLLMLYWKLEWADQLSMTGLYNRDRVVLVDFGFEDLQCCNHQSQMPVVDTSSQAFRCGKEHVVLYFFSDFSSSTQDLRTSLLEGGEV